MRGAFFLIAGTLLSAWTMASGQEASRPVDRPLQARQAEMARIEAAIAPFVQMGRETYGAAKQKFLAGLPDKYRFFVTTDLSDPNGRKEQIFVFVRSINGDMIEGIIASDLEVVSGYKKGQAIAVKDSALKDWTIAAPDGSEEGNFVGRFVDYYRPGKLFVAVFGFSVTPDGRAQGARLAMVTDESRASLNISLPPAWVSAATQKIQAQKWPSEAAAAATHERFVPFIYDPDDPRTVRAVQ